MFESTQKNTGTEYTATVTLLLMAFVASPGALFVSSPFGYPSLILALIFSATCSALAWNQWKRHSAMTIPSLSLRQK
jgi:hypothetical protein